MDKRYSRVSQSRGKHAFPILRIEEAVKHREQGGVAFELQVPEFHLYRGQFIAIVGESGCGKSTLLDMLALVLRPTSCKCFDVYEPQENGTAKRIDINELWQRRADNELARLRRHYFGYVLQSGGLLPFLTVQQNIRLPSRVKAVDQHLPYFQNLAIKMGVDSLFKRKPQHLSGGQRQRVAILRAMAHKPMLILADEPTGAVDSNRAQAIVEDFETLAKENRCTIVMVTHNYKLIESVADTIYTYTVSKISDTLTRSACFMVGG
jgi:putative ABC transport system ATP-binding protein